VDRQAAMEWVNGVKYLFRRKAAGYMMSAPYGAEDFIQDAYEAALTAADECSVSGKKFESVFWGNYKAIIAKKVPCDDVTVKHPRLVKQGYFADEIVREDDLDGSSSTSPYPAPVNNSEESQIEGSQPKKRVERDRPRCESMSLPSSYIDDNREVGDMVSAYHDRQEILRKRLIEKTFHLIAPHCSPKTQEVVSLVYGMSDKGSYPIREVARMCNVDSPATVRKYISRFVSVGEKLVESGQIDTDKIFGEVESLVDSSEMAVFG
jgi:hypothetical protein